MLERDKPLIIYGCGRWALTNVNEIFVVDAHENSCGKLLERCVCFVDRDASKHNDLFFERPVYSPEQGLRMYPEADIYIALSMPTKKKIYHSLVEQYVISPDRIINFEFQPSIDGEAVNWSIILYGAGYWGQWVAENSLFVDKMGRVQSIMSSAVCFADKDVSKHDRLHAGLPVMALSTAMARFPGAKILLSLFQGKRYQVTKELKECFDLDDSIILNCEKECLIDVLPISRAAIRAMVELLAEDDYSIACVGFDDVHAAYIKNLLKRGVVCFNENIRPGTCADTLFVRLCKPVDIKKAVKMLKDVKHVISVCELADNEMFDGLAAAFNKHNLLIFEQRLIGGFLVSEWSEGMAWDVVGGKTCNGCGACVLKCQLNAISYSENAKGFYRPSVDSGRCINCRECITACPVQVTTVNNNRRLPGSYAFSASQQMRLKSASGGAFQILARDMLAKGGKVCGVIWNGLKAQFDLIDSIGDLPKLLKSKYVQVYSCDIYIRIREELKKGTEILFCGLPCHIAGLYSFLEKDYSNLYTVDLLCHGSPSPMIFRKFIEENFNIKSVEDVTFRHKIADFPATYSDKIYGNLQVNYRNGQSVISKYEGSQYWKQYGGLDNLHYMLDGACEYCRFSSFPRMADLSIGDLHGVGTDYQISFDYEYGCSLVFANNPRGMEMVDILRHTDSKIGFEEIPLEWSAKNEIKREHRLSPMRNRFFELIKTHPLEKAFDISYNKKYDIGLVSYCNTPNYGATLNPYAIYRILKKMGKNVLMIMAPRNVTWLEEYPQCFRVNPFDKEDFAQYDTIEAMRQLNKYVDIFMMGSDQVLRTLNRTSSQRFTDLMWVTNNHKKVTYACSYGESEFIDDEEVRAELQFVLNRFDYVSVRESSCVSLMRDLFGISADCVLDPVLLLDRTEWDKIADFGDKYFGANLEKKIAAYVLDPGENNDKQQILEEVIAFTGYAHTLIKERVTRENIGERIFCEDLLAAIRNSELVVTDSFHGVLFALIYHKPFLALANKKRGLTRFESILTLCGLEERLVFCKEDFWKLEETLFNIDWKSVESKLDRERIHSMSCLEEAVKPLAELRPYSEFDATWLKLREEDIR